MAVKKVYKIKDEILNDEYEVFGQSGVMEGAGLMLLDFDQMAQYIIENTATYIGNNMYSVSEKNISATCRHWTNELHNMILDKLYDTIISDIEDDEELKMED